MGDLVIDGTVLLKWILRIRGWVYVPWILLVQYRDQWQAVVRTMMNLFLALSNAGNVLASYETVSFSGDTAV